MNQTCKHNIKQEVYLHLLPILDMFDIQSRMLGVSLSIYLPENKSKSFQFTISFGVNYKILTIGFKVCWDDKCKLSHEL